MIKEKYRLILLLIVMLTPALMLSSCVTEEEIIWDPIFVERFDLSEEAMHALNDSVQNIDQVSEQENSTVRFRQTVGDAITMNIALDITFHPDIDFASLSFTRDL